MNQHDPVTALAQQRPQALGQRDQAEPRGTKARCCRAGTQRAFFHTVKVDSKAALFSCAVNAVAQHVGQAMDGKLLLVTNVKDLTPEPVIERYTSLAGY